jgi:uncharacterized protein (TIGR02996 family)
MTTTTREAELLAEIIEHPDEDATRLVYADLLQQKDDPRGELIAVQCALAGLGILPRPSSSEWCTNAFLISPEICESEEMRRLRLREAALLKAHLKEWTKRVVEAATCTATQCRLSRGFLDHVAWRIRVNNAAPLEAVFEAAPLATSLALIGTDIAGGIESVRAFFKSKCLKSLRAFSFGSTLVNFGEGIRLLLESPHLKGVRKLEGELRGSVTQEMRLLSRGSFFDTLESLDLSSTVLTQSLPPTLPRL